MNSDESLTEATGLDERQTMVLRALVKSYVGRAGPVASKALSELLPTSLSPASVRNTLAELHGLGLIDKAHASAGRVPTPLGLRIFVERILEIGDLGPHERRLLARELDGVTASETPHQASQFLSAHTRQLGFVMAPRIDQMRLQTIHLVPIGAREVLAILVTQKGSVIERRVRTEDSLSRRQLEQIGTLLSQRVIGRSLTALRHHLEDERERLRGEADDVLERAWTLGLEACTTANARLEEDLVIATRLALLDQPEFSDPERIRGLFSALEVNERLLSLLRQIATLDPVERRFGVTVSLGAELGEPSLRECALIAMPFYVSDGYVPDGYVSNGRVTDGDEERDSRSRPLRAGAPEGLRGVGFGPDRPVGLDSAPAGVLGVIGPQRMDYGRVIPLVRYCSELVTRNLQD